MSIIGLKSNGHYGRLSTEDDEPRRLLMYADDVLVDRPSKRRSCRLATGVVIGQGFLNLFLLAVLVSLLVRMMSHKGEGVTGTCDVLYSPAQEAITYEVQFLTTKGQSKYMGDPGSPELDQAWDDLYNYIGISQIHESQAKLLPLPSDPIPIAPKYHLVELSVFHEIHCLNGIRKLLHHEQYPDIWPDGIDWSHVDHCVEVLRQSVMCSADISPMPWQWNRGMNKSMPNPDIPHSCKNWDQFMDWVMRNQMEHKYTRFALGSQE